MPDIINPLLDDNSPKIDPPLFDAFPTFKKVKEDTIPDPLLNMRDVFAQSPNKDISLEEFTTTVNGALTPNDVKDKQSQQASLDRIFSSSGVEIPKPSLPTTHFKSRDALRYKQNERLWKKYGYNPDIPSDITDAIYDHNETTWESIKNAVPKLWATTSFQYKNYFHEYLDAVEALTKVDSSILFKQERFEDFAQRQKDLEDLYPDYRTDKEVKWYQPWRGDYWEEAGSSIGFTLGTIGAALSENLVVAAATAGFGEIPELYNTPRKVYKAISDYYSLKRAHSLIKGISGAKGLKNWVGSVADGWRLINGALSEAAFEAASARHDYLETWKQDFIQKNGYAPTPAELAVAEKAGDGMAKAIIGFQTPFLMASNFAQFGNLVAPKTFAKIAEKEAMKKAGVELVNEAGKTILKPTKQATQSAFRKGATKVAGALGNSMWEGTEELYQGGTNEVTRDYFNDKYFNKDDQSILKSLGAGFDHISSNEGLKEFTAGFVTGGGFKLAGTLTHWAAKPKLKGTKKDELTGEEHPDYKYNLLNKLGFGMESVQKSEAQRKFSRIAEKLNATSLGQVLDEEGLLNLIKDKKTALALAKYVENGDLFNMRNTQNLQLMRFLFAGLTTGKIDLQVKKLTDFAQHDFTTLKNFFDLNENDYQTEEDKQAFLNSFRSFAASLTERSKEFEKIFNREKEYHATLIDKAAQDHNRKLATYNNTLTALMAKYKVDKEEGLTPKLSPDEKLKLKVSNEELIGSKYRFYAVNETLKASVFAQAGMMEDAKRAKDIIYKLNENNTIGVPYTEIGDYFTIDFRENKLKELEDRVKMAEETNAPDKDAIYEQLSEFRALSKILDSQFTKGTNNTERKTKAVADALLSYLYAVQKQINKKGNNASLLDRIDNERDNQYKLLQEFVKLQYQHQENLNMYNYLSTANNKEEFTKFQSKKLTDFFEQVDDLLTKEENKKKEEEAKKPEEAKPSTEVASVPPSSNVQTPTPPQLSEVEKKIQEELNKPNEHGTSLLQELKSAEERVEKKRKELQAAKDKGWKDNDEYERGLAMAVGSLRRAKDRIKAVEDKYQNQPPTTPTPVPITPVPPVQPPQPPAVPPENKVEPEPKPEQVQTVVEQDIEPEPENPPIVESLTGRIESQEQEVKVIPYEVDPHRAISWEYANISSKDDTEPVDAYTERLTLTPYDDVRNKVVTEFMVDNEQFEKTYQGYITKDKYPETHKGTPAVVENEGKLEFAPGYRGEVIIFRNRETEKILTIGDVFPDKYPEMNNLPVVFSFDKGIDKDGNKIGMWFTKDYQERVKIKVEKGQYPKGSNAHKLAEEDFEEEARNAMTARTLVNKDENAEIKIKFIQSTTGIYPTSPRYSPVQERFGDFELEVVEPAAQGDITPKKLEFINFSVGTVVAKIKGTKQYFPVSTAPLSSDPVTLSYIKDVLKHKFTDYAQARRIRDEYLSVVVYNNSQKQFFSIDKVTENGKTHYKINYLKVDEKYHKSGSRKDRIKNSTPVTDEQLGNVRFNVSVNGLKNGYRMWDIKTNKEEMSTPEEYLAFVKPKVVTRMKKIIDKDGNLKMQAVNPYFSFAVRDPRIEHGVTNLNEALQLTMQRDQAAYFNTSKKTIQEEMSRNILNKDARTKRLKEDLAFNRLSKQQYDELIALMNPTEEKGQDSKSDMDKKIEDIEKRREESLKEQTEEEWNNEKGWFLGDQLDGSKSYTGYHAGEELTFGTKEELLKEINARYDKDVDIVKNTYKSSSPTEEKKEEEVKKPQEPTPVVVKETQPETETDKILKEEDFHESTLDYVIKKTGRTKDEVVIAAKKAAVKGSYEFGTVLHAIKIEDSTPSGDLTGGEKKRITLFNEQLNILKGVKVVPVGETQPSAGTGRQKKNIAAIFDEEPAPVKEYKLSISSGDFTYDPATHTIYNDETGEVEDFEKSILEAFVNKYKGRTTPSGVQGFFKKELSGYVLYGFPTSKENSDVAFTKSGRNTTITKEIERKLSPEDQEKLDQFRKRNC